MECGNRERGEEGEEAEREQESQARRGGTRLLTLSFAAVSFELATLCALRLRVSVGCCGADRSLAALASLHHFHSSVSRQLRCASAALRLCSL